MNVAIEMHDSKCLAIEIDNTSQGSVLLDAYVHRTEGPPGQSAGEGGLQRIRMRIGNISVEGEIGELPTDIYEGSLAFGDSIQDNVVPFPATHSGTVRLCMMLSNDARTVIVSGSEVSIEAEGEFRFVEAVDFSQR